MVAGESGYKYAYYGSFAATTADPADAPTGRQRRLLLVVACTALALVGVAAFFSGSAAAGTAGTRSRAAVNAAGEAR